ncbi:MAG: thioredoxin family protein [Candidatus Omnitrophica bacterium]|nr:thioredoxin family protein [Candidatus Omnitrophota bacterium]
MNNTLNRQISCLLGFIFLSSLAYASGDGWIVDFEKAQEIAAKDKKDILMDFTGSDWCGYCIQLDKNVFSQDEFKTKIPHHFVLLKLDFPKDTSKQTKEEIEQNKQLNKEYQISGYPTILLTDASGRPYAKTVGYGGDSAEEYSSKLIDMQKSRIQRDAFFAKADAAQGIEKAKFLDQAISLFDEEMALSVYRKEIEQIMALDANDEAKLKSKYENVILLQDIKEQINEILKANSTDPAACVEALTKIHEDKKPTGAPAMEILYIRAFMKFQSKDMEGARADLEAAIQANPESPRVNEIQEIIQRVFKNQEANKQAQ